MSIKESLSEAFLAITGDSPDWNTDFRNEGVTDLDIIEIILYVEESMNIEVDTASLHNITSMETLYQHILTNKE